MQPLQGIPPNFRPAVPFCWQEQGYWHIARAQVHSRRYGLETYYYNDMANNLRTGHMDVTFQPTFYASPYGRPGGLSRAGFACLQERK